MDALYQQFIDNYLQITKSDKQWDDKDIDTDIVRENGFIYKENMEYLFIRWLSETCPATIREVISVDGEVDFHNLFVKLKSTGVVPVNYNGFNVWCLVHDADYCEAFMNAKVKQA